MDAKARFSVALDEGEYAELLDLADKHRISVAVRRFLSGDAAILAVEEPPAKPDVRAVLNRGFEEMERRAREPDPDR